MAPKLPNAEVLVSEWARADADVVAALGSKVFTDLPAGFKDWPAARVIRVGGRPKGSHPLVLDQPILQVDVWGGPKLTACDVADTIRAAAAERLPGTHRLGIVYRCEVGALLYMPDDNWDPPRPRYVFDLSLMTRAPQ